MIKIIKEPSRLLAVYEPQNNSNEWVDRHLREKGYVLFRRTFRFTENLHITDSEDLKSLESNRTFALATFEGEFYKIDKKILGLKHDLLLHKDLDIYTEIFVAYREISIFRKIDNLVDEPISIGGPSEDSIPISEFIALLQTFPNTTELTHYAGSRIARILKSYFVTMSDPQKKLETYLQKKQLITTKKPQVSLIMEYELQKFVYIREELDQMLKEVDSYAENEWQKIISNFLLFIFPKYISVLENVQIKDFYFNRETPTNRFIDLTLVDSNGTLDILEIKKPFANGVLRSRKYRDNFIPQIELSGAVMQVEKYIFHLTKWGRIGEDTIQKKYIDKLPFNCKINITNPSGMIILGRDLDFSEEQKFDFEIIKRKYANILDIMTYDDLLKRLDNIISVLQNKTAKQ